MKNYVKNKIKKIEKEKKEKADIKDAKWIGEDSHILFKKLYSNDHQKQISELLNYLNENNRQKLSSYDTVSPSTQTGFHIYIYEDKEQIPKSNKK